MRSTNELDANRKCLSIVVPAFNEAATLSQIIAKLALVPNLLEVIIVEIGGKRPPFAPASQ
jgi:hypothetical protein